MNANKETDNKNYRKQEIENLKKQILHSAVLSFCALCALVFVSVAWFMNNSKVSGNNLNVTADGEPFQLRTAGSTGIHDNVLQLLMQNEGTEEDWYQTADNGYSDTSETRSVANWLLTNKSNLNNIDTNEEVESNRDYYSLQPGKEGYIEFTVLPKREIAITFNLELIPYKLTSSTTEGEQFVKVNDDMILNFVKGHILFFLVTESNKTVEWLSDGIFSDSLTNDTVYKIYWVWPQTLSELILKSGDPYLSGRNVLLSNFSNNGESVRSIINGSAGENRFSMKNMKERYFFKFDGDNNYNNIPDNLDEIFNMNEDLEDNTANKKIFINLNSAYNQADQSIGLNVDCVRLRLTAVAQ